MQLRWSRENYKSELQKAIGPIIQKERLLDETCRRTGGLLQALQGISRQPMRIAIESTASGFATRKLLRSTCQST